MKLLTLPSLSLQDPVRTATPRFNGSMENFHGRIEAEFYDLEELPTLSTLLNKAYTYMLYLDLERVNLDLKGTPFEMVRERNHIQDPKFMDFPRVMLDYLSLRGPELLSVKDVSDDLTFESIPGLNHWWH